ncbi:hypothetical protein GGTG_14302, partial [Gaeumannomyces tritici R3-111a-1]
MKFNVAQALAILAVTNPAVALQSTDYADNLAIVARDINPEAATASASIEEAPVLEARDPRRGRIGGSRPAKGGGGGSGSRVEIGAHVAGRIGSSTRDAEQMAAAKRDLEARDPRRGRVGGSRPAKGGGGGSGNRLEKAAN